ncbi:Spy/CpxP family protein refolding chaperone [Glaciecola sp. 1036]|uniref:Spy/CpxP family protein refolding chaperone n=1 Tax=Alteromonadaceae TaxID=72275 RepID=UPI003D00AA83
MKKLLITLIVSTSLSVSSLAVAGGPKEEGKHPFSQLDLSESQRQDIALIMRDLRGDNSLFRGERHHHRTNMRELMSMQSWDEEKAEAIIRQGLENSHQLEINRAKAKHLAYQVLTEDQRAELKQMYQSGPKNKDRGEYFKQFGKNMNLSEEQQSQIKQLWDTQHSQLAALKPQMMLHKQAERELIAAEEFDEQAYLALHQENIDTQVQMQLIRQKTRFDMMQILTPEQKKSMKQEFKQKFKERFSHRKS